jgi:hypothetical protein
MNSARLLLILSRIVTLWALALCISVSCAVKWPEPETPQQYQAANSNSAQPRNGLNNEESSAWITAVIPAVCGLVGAALGGWITWLSAEKSRKKKSIYAIADRFQNEAVDWASNAYRPGHNFAATHNAIIDSLSPHVNYLERRHEKICAKIWPHWVFFHGGDAGKSIHSLSYYRSVNPANPVERKPIPKDEWSLALYAIADVLRES